MSIVPIQILHADNDEDDRLLFDHAVIKASIDSDTVHAKDGAECIDKLKIFVPDIIFLDLNMAGMNGKECLKLIRNQREFDTIPIIMLTTSAYEADIADTFQSGANRFITKPFVFEDLIILLKAIFTDNWKANLLKSDFESYVISGK